MDPSPSASLGVRMTNGKDIGFNRGEFYKQPVTVIARSPGQSEGDAAIPLFMISLSVPEGGRPAFRRIPSANEVSQHQGFQSRKKKEDLRVDSSPSASLGVRMTIWKDTGNPPPAIDDT